MKSLRKSRSAQNRNARKAFVKRGQASSSSAALFAPDVVLGGRAFRRANGLSLAEAAIIAPALRPEHGATGYGRVSLTLDPDTRRIMSRFLS